MVVSIVASTGDGQPGTVHDSCTHGNANRDGLASITSVYSSFCRSDMALRPMAFRAVLPMHTLHTSPCCWHAVLTVTTLKCSPHWSLTATSSSQYFDV